MAALDFKKNPFAMFAPAYGDDGEDLFEAAADYLDPLPTAGSDDVDGGQEGRL